MNFNIYLAYFQIIIFAAECFHVCGLYHILSVGGGGMLTASSPESS